MTVTQETAKTSRRKREVPPGVFLVLGVVVVPALIVIATTSYGVSPDAQAYVQMAFAVVAGQTIAIATVVGVLVTAIVRRGSVGSIVTFAIIAAVVTSLALSTISSQAAHLVRILAV